MLNGKSICVVMPAYNAAATLQQTYADIPKDIVDKIVLVDDASTDNTRKIARTLGLDFLEHGSNKGYGANQKTCYTHALKLDMDIIIMLHPDYQYSPRLIGALASMIAYGEYDAVIASRILGTGALLGGMPYYKYISNRLLTFAQNILCNRKFSEYHSGYRAYAKNVLNSICFEANSDGFVFDNQLFMQMLAGDFRIGEISCPTRYFPEASSIRFWPSVKYGLGCLTEGFSFLLHRWGIRHNYRLRTKDVL